MPKYQLISLLVDPSDRCSSPPNQHRFRHEPPRRMGRGLEGLAFALMAGMAASVSGQSTLGQIGLDGSLGPRLALSPNAANQFHITSGFGSQIGPNLFHSFSQFNVGPGQEAVFSGPSSVQNILARITDGASSIDGKLTSQIPGANLFLLNPRGITFGAGATLNLKGGFYASTANYVALGDGRHFDATATAGAVLSAAPPTAFGFIGSGAGKLTVSQAKLNNSKGGISLVGGDIDIEGDGPQNVALVQAPGKSVVLASMKSAGELPIAVDQIPAAASRFSQQGAISLTAAAAVGATPPVGGAGGQVVIRGGKLTVQNANIAKASYQASDGWGIDVETTGDIELGAGAVINSQGRQQEGKASGLRLQGENLLLVSGSHIQADNLWNGQGSDIDLSAHTTLRLGGELRASNSEGAHGTGSRITISAHDFELAEGGVVFLENRGDGEAPSLQVHAETMQFDPFTSIRAGTYFGVGSGASLTFDVGTMQLEQGSQIGVGTLGPGLAGSITVHAAGAVTVSQGAQISSATSGTGNGGLIQIIAQSIKIGDSSLVATALGSGSGGAIELRASDIQVTGPAATVTSVGQGSGKAGTILLAGERSVTVDSGAKILVASDHATAGNVQLTAGDSLRLLNATISAAGTEGGNISLGAGGLVYLLDSTVSAATTSGKGGNIAVPRLNLPDGTKLDSLPGVIPQFVVLNRSALSANATVGQGGNVAVDAAQFVKSADSPINVSSTFGQSGHEDVPIESFDFTAALPELRTALWGLVPRWEAPASWESTDPGGYTSVGRRRQGENENRRRLILER